MLTARFYIKKPYCAHTGTAVAQWLRCCATNRKVGRSLVRSQLMSLEIFIDIKSFRSHYGPGVDSASNRNEYREYFMGVKAASAYGWQPYHHPVPLSCNLGTLTSWNPLGHSRPVMGLLYLYCVHAVQLATHPILTCWDCVMKKQSLCAVRLAGFSPRTGVPLFKNQKSGHLSFSWREGRGQNFEPSRNKNTGRVMLLKRDLR